MSFSLAFTTDNEAFAAHPREEVARILHRVLMQVQDERDEAPIFDINGNSVGAWSLTLDDKEEPDGSR